MQIAFGWHDKAPIFFIRTDSNIIGKPWIVVWQQNIYTWCARKSQHYFVQGGC